MSDSGLQEWLWLAILEDSRIIQMVTLFTNIYIWIYQTIPSWPKQHYVKTKQKKTNNNKTERE